MDRMQDDLSSLRDDMTAFIEGHGMRRFLGRVDAEDVPTVAWDSPGNPDGWKDFVELARSAGATFLTMNAFRMERNDVDYIVEQLRHSHFADADEVEEARWLRTHIGKTGYLQIGWPHQGVVFTCEMSTEWYTRYQRLVEMAEEFGGTTIDEADQDDEKGSF